MPTRFTDPEPVANRFNRKRDWDAAREAAFDRAVLNQTLLAAALTNLLTEVQLVVPVAPVRLRQAEQEAVRALSAVGGPPALSPAHNQQPSHTPAQKSPEAVCGPRRGGAGKEGAEV